MAVQAGRPRHTLGTLCGPYTRTALRADGWAGEPPRSSLVPRAHARAPPPQFGYVSLFSMLFPPTAAIALLIGGVQLRLDAFKARGERGAHHVATTQATQEETPPARTPT
jgi:hypothetical protein